MNCLRIGPRDSLSRNRNYQEAGKIVLDNGLVFRGNLRCMFHRRFDLRRQSLAQISENSRGLTKRVGRLRCQLGSAAPFLS